MKKFIKPLMVVAASAMILPACTDALDEVQTLPAENSVALTISTDRPDAVDTRTMVADDGITPMWCADDAIGVSVFDNGTYTNSEFTNDNSEASAITTFSGTTVVSETIYTYYPYSSDGVTAQGRASVTIPAVQHPSPTSFDGAADILVGKPAEMTPQTTKIEGLQFKRVGGFLKIVLKDATAEGLITGQAVSSVSVTAETALAGSLYLDIVNGQLEDIYSGESATVTAAYASDTQYSIGDETAAACIGVCPRVLAEGSTITVAAVTDNYEISREIKLPYDIDVKAGQIITLNVNISEANISDRIPEIPEDMAVAFPDLTFRNNVLNNFDTNRDGRISAEEALAVTKISISNVASLEGVQYFTNLTSLSCSNSWLNRLDVSKNTKLTELICHSNDMISLDVSKNTALTRLLCYSNLLTTLDVSGCSALTTLNCSSNLLKTLDVSKNTALTILTCSTNQLTTLDVSQNKELTQLWCGSNQLTSLNVSNLAELDTLSCYSNRLTSLDVSKNTKLAYLNCHNNQLTSLEVSQNTALTELVCSSNQLTILDVSQNTGLETLNCDSNQLTELDASECSVLTSFTCKDNQLTKLVVPQNMELITLNCYSNRLTTLDISGCWALQTLRCYSNQLTELDLSNNIVLSTLDCAPMESLEKVYIKVGQEISRVTTDRNDAYIPANTQIVYVDNNEDKETVSKFPDPSFRLSVLNNFDTDHDGRISEDEALAVTRIDVNRINSGGKILSLEGVQYFTNLEYLDCSSNSLPSLNLSKNTALTTLLCSHNKLTYLNLSNLPALETLSCYSNQLTSLDVSENTALTDLICYSNQLTNLDVSNNTKLTTLNCYSNQLTNLNISGCSSLTTLNCSSNQLTNLNFDGCSALTTLNCIYNNLTNLNISGCSALTSLICYYNQLTTLNANGCSALTSLNCSSNQLTNLNFDGCSALTTLNCYSNPLTNLNIDGCPALTTLRCYSNQLTNLDVSNCTNLSNLSCYDNLLTDLDVSKTALNTAANAGNAHPLDCAPMATLKTLTLKAGWVINGITPDRNDDYIPAQTQIIFKD